MQKCFVSFWRTIVLLFLCLKTFVLFDLSRLETQVFHIDSKHWHKANKGTYTFSLSRISLIFPNVILSRSTSYPTIDSKVTTTFHWISMRHLRGFSSSILFFPTDDEEMQKIMLRNVTKMYNICTNKYNFLLLNFWSNQK